MPKIPAAARFAHAVAQVSSNLRYLLYALAALFCA
jgi:hypothetical protein